MVRPAAPACGVRCVRACPDRLLGMAVVFPVEPMLAAAGAEIPGAEALPGGCQWELKFDGYRLIGFVDVGRVRLQSRNGHDITAAFPEIAEALVDQVPPGSVVDGELVVWGETGLDFAALQQRLGARKRARVLSQERPATLLLFDVLALDGREVMDRPFSERSALLDDMASGLRPPIQRVPCTRDMEVARAWMSDHANARTGVEGLVVKGLATRYRPGQRDWVKVRIRDTVDVVVGAVTGSLRSPSRLVVGYWVPGRDGRRLRVAGATTPLSSRQRVEVSRYLEPLRDGVDGEPWPPVIPAGWVGLAGGEDLHVHAVEPTLVVEVSADTAFERGRWRHPLPFVRVRPDQDSNTIAAPYAGRADD